MTPGGTDDGFVNNDDFSTDMGPPDMVPRKMFGEPCNDKSECETEICIFTGLGGICSRLCPPACPGNFGCFGVLGGGIDPGAVVDVCVPITTQLCTPCMAASECSAGGKDLCLPAATGGTFCGRDCSTIACPMGYSCQTVMQAGNPFKQCVPNSGSCDCNSAANMGLMQTCQITTPFGMCAGTRTCNGATGWGACAPPSATDVPDGNFKDDNCDGIDGDINAGIFVAKSGVDNSTCGLTPSTPCLSINGGILRASDESKKYVYVQAGDYSEVVIMLSGKHVYGGFNTMWKRASRTTGGHLVRIIGGFDTSEAQYMAVRAHNLAGLSPTTLADVEIVAPSPPGALTGRTSYGVHAYRALLALDRVTVIAGNGTTGSTGSTGGNASASAAAGGAGGGDAHYSEGETCGSVSGSSAAGGGGGGGTNSCSGGRNPNAGGGGKGGPRDTSCGSCGGVCSLGGICGGNCNAQAGSNGTAATDTNGGANGGAGPLGGTCAVGNGGGGGDVDNGTGGLRGATRGVMVLSNKYWSATSGNGGSVGDNGTGGGGGGGSGGCDDGFVGDSYGAGGGGGGAGGCRASSGGGGGGGGGGSFAIFATDTSTVTVTNSDIQRGNGGDGGTGGQGGRGQPHGAGNTGGQGAGGSKTGGSGGNGGHGGHSGGGAGGSGGVSAAFFSFSSTITVSGGTATGGSAGAAGASGPIPTSSYGDGNPGQTGAAGSLQSSGTFTCSAAGGC